MSKVETVRGLINQRLSAAAAEIFELFERTIAEYEEQLCRSKEENERQKKLLDAVLKPEVILHRADVQQVSLSKEEICPERQERTPSPVLEDPEEPHHVKAEHEELWSSQEENEELQGLKEEDVSSLVFAPVPVKSEEDVAERLGFSDHTEMTRDREDCGGSGQDRNFSPHSSLQAVPHVQTSHFSQCEPDYMSWYFDHTRATQTSFNPEPNQDVSDFRCEAKVMAVSSSEAATSFSPKTQTQKHDRVRAEEKPFVCSVCGQRYQQKHSLTIHMRLHLEGRHLNCPVCKKSFLWQAEVQRHMRTHTGEKPFSCQFCGKRFAVRSNLKSHVQVHTGEKPFSCSVCEAPFRRREGLDRHMKTHTGEKPYSCSICGKRFIQRATMKRHLMVHTGEKPYSCSMCEKRFSRFEYMKTHRCVGWSNDNLFG